MKKNTKDFIIIMLLVIMVMSYGLIYNEIKSIHYHLQEIHYDKCE